ERFVDGYYRVPKRDLIVGLQVMVQQGAMQIAGDLPFRDTLLREMTEMRVRITPGRNEQYGAWRGGGNGELGVGVGRACWGVGKVWPRVLTGAAAYWGPGG